MQHPAQSDDKMTQRQREHCAEGTPLSFASVLLPLRDRSENMQATCVEEAQARSSRPQGRWRDEPCAHG